MGFFHTVLKIANKNLANWIFRANHQTFDLPIIPHAVYSYSITIMQLDLRNMAFLHA